MSPAPGRKSRKGMKQPRPTPEQREEFNYLAARGISYAAIARNFGFHRDTVSDIVNNRRPSRPSPRPRKRGVLSARGDRALMAMVTRHGIETVGQIKKEFTTAVLAYSTILRHLNKMGIKAYRKIHRPLLTERHKKARLLWAKERRGWTIAQWQKVLFTDETKIMRIHYAGTPTALCRKGDIHDPKRTIGTVKFGGELRARFEFFERGNFV